MSKPERTRDIKPKEEKANDGAGKIIFMNIVTTTIVCAIFLGANYFLMQKAIPFNNQANVEEEIIEESNTDDEIERGLILDLGEFTMNLADVTPRRYLKVDVALEVTKTEKDLELLSAPVSTGGHGHGGGASPADAAKAIATEMEQFKPAIRDSVITTLTSKMSDELATTAGKEIAKDQIKEAVNGIFAGEREVIRVSFGQFIIQ